MSVGNRKFLSFCGDYENLSKVIRKAAELSKKPISAHTHTHARTHTHTTDVVICLEQDADLHMAQLTLLPLPVSCLSKIQIGFIFWYRLTRVVLDKRLLNGCVYLTVQTCKIIVVH